MFTDVKIVIMGMTSYCIKHSYRFDVDECMFCRLNTLEENGEDILNWVVVNMWDRVPDNVVTKYEEIKTSYDNKSHTIQFRLKRKTFDDGKGWSKWEDVLKES